MKGTVTEDYQGILAHDHEPCFYSYDSGHQECLAHVLRYLKGSMENEPGRGWNRKMRELLQEMIHYANTEGMSRITEMATTCTGGWRNIWRIICCS